MRVITHSGSVYEFDLEGSRVRRLNSTVGTSERVGSGGEWRPYLRCSTVQLGEVLVIAWRYDVENDILQTTITSPVVAIESDSIAS